MMEIIENSLEHRRNSIVFQTKRLNRFGRNIFRIFVDEQCLTKLQTQLIMKLVERHRLYISVRMTLVVICIVFSDARVNSFKPGVLFVGHRQTV